MKLNLKAFTLAEILITLVIVGVIACLTLPTLLSKIDKTRNIATLKRAYAELSGEVKQFMIDNDCTSRLSDCSASGQFVFDFPKYLYYQRGWVDAYNVVKVGNSSTTPAHMLTLHKKNQPHYYNVVSSIDTEQPYKFLSSKGGAYYIRTSSFPTDMRYATDKGDYIRLRIDVYTNPSSVIPPVIENYVPIWANYPILGREVFVFYVTDSGRVIPCGSSESTTSSGYYCIYWKKNAGNCETDKGQDNAYAGIGCAARIIEDGWQMNY